MPTGSRLPYYRIDRRSGWVPTGAISILVLLLVVGPVTSLTNPGTPTTVPTAPPAALRAASNSIVPSVSDGVAVSVTLGLVHSLLRDSIQYGTGQGSQRSYTITVGVSIPLPLLYVNVSTSPLVEWSYPQQMPGGADALPPLANWTWSVKGPSGHVDTANWTVPRWGSELVRSMTWTNHTFVVSGVSNPTYSVTAWAPRSGGLLTPGAALVLNPGGAWSGPAYPSYDPRYPGLVRSLAPQFLRFSVLQGTSVHWDSTTGAPVFNFTGVDESFSLATSTGAGVFYSIPVGTWGDGNLLPKGMPLNLGLPILGVTGPGFLPTPAAYRVYIQTIVDHVAAAKESVEYWDVGNEMPLMNRTVVLAFIQLFNVAQRVIHTTFPNDSVGTDVMMNRTYLGTFANLSNNVGYLSYHFYPDIGLCIQDGVYCPPKGNPNGTLDSTLWKTYATVADNHRFYPPAVAQSLWRNLTGDTIPVVNSESNLDGVGGSPVSNANGTDPRQQTLLGAAWLGFSLIQAAAENVSSFAYFTLTGPNGTPPTITGPYGGFGYGMTSELPNGAHTLFAPYWALRLFSRNFPAGSSGAVLSVPDPNALRSYAVVTPSGLAVFVVNLNAVNVTIDMRENMSGFAPSHLKTLDQRSYAEQFRASTDTTVVVRSGVRQVALNPNASMVKFSLGGYGIAVVRYTPDPGGPSGEPFESGGTLGAPSAGMVGPFPPSNASPAGVAPEPNPGGVVPLAGTPGDPTVLSDLFVAGRANFSAVSIDAVRTYSN